MERTKRWAGIVLLMTALWGRESAAGQDVSGGVQLGVTSSTLVSDSANAGRRRGVSAGAFLELAPTNSISIRVEVLYATSGATLGGATLALAYVQIPVVLKLDLGGSAVRRTLFAGPSIGGTLVSEIRGPVGTSELTNVRAWELGWVAGAGIEVGIGGQRLLLDGRYSRGVTGVFEDAGDKNQALSLSVGWYLF